MKSGKIIANIGLPLTIICKEKYFRLGILNSHIMFCLHYYKPDFSVYCEGLI